MTSSEKPYILIVYYSRTGHTQALAENIAEGVESHNCHLARLRALPPVRPSWQTPGNSIPESGFPYASVDDLKFADGLALGSPTRFGNMASSVQYYLESAGSLWHAHDLVNKPAGVFCSTGSQHGGQEHTLWNLIAPLLHMGMIPIGVPYSESALMTTTSGGTPYGPSHVAGANNYNELSSSETQIACAFGKRLSQVAQQLKPLFKN